MNVSGRNDALTVTQLNTYIGQIFESTDVLSGIRLCGEISNFKRHSSGHLYFSLKDEGSVIRCVMFRSAASRLKFSPEDGMKITAFGSVTVYVAAGQYQLYVQSMDPDGVGALYIAFEQLKKKLAGEGLFSDDRKKPIPKYPERVGLITSPTGAAIQDLTNILSRRYPLAEVVLYPALVQGESAAATLIAGIQYFSLHKPDVIIIGRGGGSIEDLWCFNDEDLAREIYACDVPVISAVGHEIDFTICDFVADLRAPTPSAAAELAVPDMRDILRMILEFKSRAEHGIAAKLQGARNRFLTAKNATVLSSTDKMLRPYYLRLDAVTDVLDHAIHRVYTDKVHQLTVVSEKLHALSPLAVLSRGYAFASDETGKTIKSARNIHEHDAVKLHLADGYAVATVDSVTVTKESE